MKPENILAQLDKALKSHQAEYRITGIHHLPELESELHQQFEMGSFNKEFFQERLTFFNFKPPDDGWDATSIIIASVPQPITVVHFTYNGIKHPVTLPPTYDQQTDQNMKESLEEVLNSAGYRISRARIPEKMMGTHSGLMQYGRNNIGYVRHMGSFHRPVTFFSDLPCNDDHWESPVMMERCFKCKACIKACPTHAIGEDRFLLHAERCITFHNEHLKEIPGYLQPSMHHCLFGCMICQKVCPENRKFVDRVEVKEYFSEGETTNILSGMLYDQLAPNTQQKLDRLSLTEDYSLLARNLGFLLHQLIVNCEP
jgi:epoxyqueuosine reductase